MMPELSVAIVTNDGGRFIELRQLVDSTGVARTVKTNPDVVLVDIPSDNVAVPVRAIELLRQEIPKSVVFAVGSLNRPQVVVNAMLAGAREFIERPTTTTDLRKAFITPYRAAPFKQEGAQGMNRSPHTGHSMCSKST